MHFLTITNNSSVLIVIPLKIFIISLLCSDLGTENQRKVRFNLFPLESVRITKDSLIKANYNVQFSIFKMRTPQNLVRIERRGDPSG